MKRLEWKVGIFVLIGLALLAALLVEFSKGMSLFRPTYTLYVRAENAGLLVTGAQVRMAGVQIGSVSQITLASSGRNVILSLRIYNEFKIFRDARFVIEQSGFLGDQYVAIVPTKNEGAYFQPGETAQAEAPFNLQEFTRSASGFISRIDDTVKKLNQSLVEVQRLVLNPETLTNLAQSAANLRAFSKQARVTLDRVDGVIATNGPALSYAATNLVAFSGGMKDFAASLNGLLATNSTPFNAAVSNIAESTESLKHLLAGVQAGQGMAGEMLRSPQMAGQFNEIVNNLSITTSNLNRLGLWGILWRHKPPEPAAPPPRVLKSPKAKN